MTRLIVVEPGPPARAALVVDGRLEDLLIDPPEGDDAPRMEEIHRARIRRVIKGQGAAHLKLAGGGKGFLRDAKGVAEGDLVIAQVTGHAEPGKGTPMTARRLHRGRYAILSPDSPGVNVARSLKDAERRAHLAALGAAALAGGASTGAALGAATGGAATGGAEINGAADGPGLILRSAAATAPDNAIREDIEDLLALEAALAGGGPPEKLADGPGAEVIAWREWGDPDELVREKDAFDRLGLWDAIDALRSPVATLPGGAWMSVEPTAALVAVDVNTGGDLGPEAASRANRAAALDLPRQLRLRGLGGQIVVDFAPMRKADRKAMESALRKALAADTVQTTLAGWTPLGHFEMMRKRERRPVTELLPDV